MDAARAKRETEQREAWIAKHEREQTALDEARRKKREEKQGKSEWNVSAGQTRKRTSAKGRKFPSMKKKRDQEWTSTTEELEKLEPSVRVEEIDTSDRWLWV